METEDDMIVVVVVGDDEDKSALNVPSEVKIKPEFWSNDALEVTDIIKTAKKLGQYIDIKLEPIDNNEGDNLEEEAPPVLIKELKCESTDETSQDTNVDNDAYVSDGQDLSQDVESDTQQDSDKHRSTMLKPWQQRSFVAELRQEYPELQEDEELLINTLEQIMRSAKPPPPPKDYYVMTGIMFECVICGALTESIPAASRHYQEKHGQRYLVCYACGVDFRSPSNLYKHEKRCVAPDASIVLKARAACLGRKGRSRPYLKQLDKIRFPCQYCSAVFVTRSNLQSHENLHRGERPYKCTVCSRAYTSYNALSRHTVKHTDIKYICDHCNRSFNVKASLMTHMYTHDPQLKHGCSECSRRFGQKSALKVHFNKVHRKLPPPCACQICPKRYYRMSVLKSHMKLEHGMSIITRQMFFKSLPTMTDSEIKQSKWLSNLKTP